MGGQGPRGVARGGDRGYPGLLWGEAEPGGDGAEGGGTGRRVQEAGREVFQRVVLWAAEGEVRSLADVVGEEGKIVVEL